MIFGNVDTIAFPLAGGQFHIGFHSHPVIAPGHLIGEVVFQRIAKLAGDKLGKRKGRLLCQGALFPLRIVPIRQEQPGEG